MRHAAVKCLACQAQPSVWETMVIFLKSFQKKKAEDWTKKTENRQKGGDREKKKQVRNKERDRKVGIPSIEFPEGGRNAIYTDRPPGITTGEGFHIDQEGSDHFFFSF